MDKRYLKRMTRYWEMCHSKVISSFDVLDWNGWFDLWHIHYDRKAKGNRQPNKPYSNFLGYQLLKEAEGRCATRSRPSQCFLCLYPDVSNDAVYIHTQNPNKDSVEFPYIMSDVTWGVTDNEILNEVVNINTHDIGRINTDEYNYYIVIKKNLAK